MHQNDSLDKMDYTLDPIQWIQHSNECKQLLLLLVSRETTHEGRLGVQSSLVGGPFKMAATSVVKAVDLQ